MPVSESTTRAVSVAEPTLTARGIGHLFSGTRVLEDVNLSLWPGEIHGIVGENGAGKSTLIKLLSGVHTPVEGRIILNGEEVQFRSPADAIAQGIAVVHQELSAVPDLTVAENILLGGTPSRLGIVDRKALRRRAEWALAEVDSAIDPSALCRTLSLGQQQLVEIARALARDARVLILDEPSTVLGYEDLESLYRAIDRVLARGVAVGYISHRFPELFRITTRMTVLRDGKAIATTPTAELDEETLIRQMTGRDLTPAPRQRKDLSEELLLDARGVSVPGRVHGVDVSVRAGEVVCLTGLMGAGRSETVKAIIGAGPGSVDELTVHGTRITRRSPQRLLNHGVALVPEDRRREGLLLNRSIKENATLTALRSRALSRFGVLRTRSERQVVERTMAPLRPKYIGIGQNIGQLSGGNQQKVLLGRTLMSNPSVFILDEPTRGIDIGAKSDIYDLISGLADAGAGVLIVSSEIEEVLAISDRVIVFRDGVICAELRGDDITDTAISHAQLSGTSADDQDHVQGERQK